MTPAEGLLRVILGRIGQPSFEEASWSFKSDRQAFEYYSTKTPGGRELRYYPGDDFNPDRVEIRCRRGFVVQAVIDELVENVFKIARPAAVGVGYRRKYLDDARLPAVNFLFIVELLWRAPSQPLEEPAQATNSAA